jgi:hypothetical protein
VFGVGTYAYKTYSGLPGHNSLTVQWDAYYLDTWDGALNGYAWDGFTYSIYNSTPPWFDSYLLYVDSTLQYWNIYVMGTISNTNICGNPLFPDWITTVTLILPHNSSTIQLNFTTGLNQDCTDEEFGFKNIQITVDVICTPACATCFGNANTQCYSCNNGWYLSGNTCGTTCPQGYYPSETYCYSIFLLCISALPNNYLLFFRLLFKLL